MINAYGFLIGQKIDEKIKQALYFIEMNRQWKRRFIAVIFSSSSFSSSYHHRLKRRTVRHRCVAIIDKPSAKLSLYLLFLGLAVSLLGSAANMSTDVSLVSFFFFSLLIKFPQPERLKTSPTTSQHMVPGAPFAALHFHIFLGGKFIDALKWNGINRFIFVLFLSLPIFRI